MPLIKYPKPVKSNSDHALVNPYFNYGQSLGNVNELTTYRDIVSECIQIHGYAVTVIRRDHPNFDRIWIEDPNSKFVRSFTIEMMVLSGDMDSTNPIMTRFGIQFDQDLTLAVSYDRWSALWYAQENPDSKEVLVPQQPQQGDLLLINVGRFDSRGYLTKNPDDFGAYLYELMESDGNPYRMNGTQWYVLTARKFDYSAEPVETGNNETYYEQDFIDKWNPHKNGGNTINAILDKEVEADEANVAEPLGGLQPQDNVQATNWFARNRDIEITGQNIVVDDQFQKGPAQNTDEENVPNTVSGDALIGEDW